MKKKLRIMLGAILAVLCFGIFASDVEAGNPAEVSLPVTMLLEGTFPEDEKNFEILLKAEDTENPMPAGSENGEYGMKITKEGMYEFPVISFTEPGIYKYTVCQIPGVCEKCTYDERVYQVIIYVTNERNGNGLEITVVVYEENALGTKTELEFLNNYKTTHSHSSTEEHGDGNVKTGDLNQMECYALLCLLSVTVLTGILIRNKIYGKIN